MSHGVQVMGHQVLVISFKLGLNYLFKELSYGLTERILSAWSLTISPTLQLLRPGFGGYGHRPATANSLCSLLSLD